MRWLAVILGLAAWAAGPAMATPPRATMSDDRMVAATQSHLYVLRDVVDNIGSHYDELRDQHLVEISLETGEATRFWPLRRVAVSRLETGELLNPGMVTERPGEVHDMMAVLRDAGAQPLSPNAWPEEGVTLEEGALVRDGETVLTAFGLRAAGRAQLGILRDAYPPIESEAEYRRAERIDFYDLYAEGDWDCRVLPDRQTLFRQEQRLILVKLRCEDAALSGAWSFHAMIGEDP
ncbi:hypothetical protein [Roseovarius sp.]|uniref:hypothetical protein n=1 Tax=Roseovarius sp. TaxID=1486281 RepID=UPI002639F3B8|nr:hypothetical protein [Roseovarius sp.]MDM8166080.1 hypothetical protein [Roseovarius sp.]